MFEIINKNFHGATITLAVTGLPLLITGEVVSSNNNIVTLRLNNGSKIYVESNLIAFFY
ncbi:hypothetical protein NSA50_02260 [Clostridium sp. DSM 100503]|uniref:DUF6897 domain-containing protein n=1 Tax=Clostridium sp. DSM 100503 TaxID=2963282 RepID=UPI00214A6EAA|nr:hypothetical protein [Clostridium sp. DSM 100503]MCR1949882.1 hypothetical protein [Clostridium sp. DSM 100503]